MESTTLRENFTESFITSLRYARNSQRMKIILFRNVLFALVISIVPALLPSSRSKKCTFPLPNSASSLRAWASGPWQERCWRCPTSERADLAECDHLDRDGDSGRGADRDDIHVQLPALMICAALAGVAWALAGSELWVAGQRVMPGWVRGRMNSFQIILGQGGIAIGALIWGTGVANVGLDLTFAAAAVLR